jgi:hypothetical protein
VTESRGDVRRCLMMSGIVIPFILFAFRRIDLGVSYEYSIYDSEYRLAVVEQITVAFRVYGIIACLVMPLALLLYGALSRGGRGKGASLSRAFHDAALVCLINLMVFIMVYLTGRP